MLPTTKHPNAVDTAKRLTRGQQDALRAIAFFRRQRKLGTGWLVGDKRLSEKVVGRLEQLDLVEESFVRGEPLLQLTIVGQAIEARLLQ
ncbi:hypothetical protein BLJAPNOD_05346 [Ensifer sp. M14]|jgi:hypothetical protein|uniref:hypothetical protein n=1 Tax=Sinorhizobium/Ensifer group TaxID=227292 RepID=UPI0009859F72|nr:MULTISPECIES: hypothetical protein [Sinorhizobium/Ensifer group]OOG61812.1 hypothetical protein B0E45_32255 [Sinorhizobium sp. A49]RDL47846.1 hypothetical protein BLJAPNOD_05346 [Ensifer sp. M14]